MRSAAETHANSNNTAAATALTAPSDLTLRVPCYCEENVWRLAYRKLQQQDKNTKKRYHVVFVSNANKCVCFFYQKASGNPMKPVLWDYHVLLIEEETIRNHDVVVSVLDVDSYLPYPCPLSHYVQYSFPQDKNVAAAPQFRVLEATQFLQVFASDRMHMWNEAKQEWLATPPTYDCITNDDNNKSSNLSTFINMQENLDHPQYGQVLNLPQLLQRFGCT